MTRKKFRDLAAPLLADPVQRLLIEEEKHAIDVALALGKLRESRESGLQDAEERTDGVEIEAPRIEFEESLYLTVLRQYTEALGGRIEIRAVFPDQSVQLIGHPSADLDHADEPAGADTTTNIPIRS